MNHEPMLAHAMLALTLLSKRRVQRPLTPEEEAKLAKRLEVDEWNAAVDQRKAEKAARKAIRSASKKGQSNG